MAWNRDVVEDAEAVDPVPERIPGAAGPDPTTVGKVSPAALAGHTCRGPGPEGGGRNSTNVREETVLQMNREVNKRITTR